MLIQAVHVRLLYSLSKNRVKMFPDLCKLLSSAVCSNSADDTQSLLAKLTDCSTGPSQHYRNETLYLMIQSRAGY